MASAAKHFTWLQHTYSRANAVQPLYTNRESQTSGAILGPWAPWGCDGSAANCGTVL